jgi:hypothetical protein
LAHSSGEKSSRSYQQPLPTRAPAIEASHIGLIDDHHVGGIQISLPLTPLLADGGDVRPLLLAGLQSFFEGQLLTVEDRRHQSLRGGLCRAGHSMNEQMLKQVEAAIAGKRAGVETVP